MIAFSLQHRGHLPRDGGGALESNRKLWQEIFPEWGTRVHHDTMTPEGLLNVLREGGVELKNMAGSPFTSPDLAAHHRGRQHGGWL